MTEQQQVKIIEHCKKLRIYNDVKFIVYQFMITYPFSDKKISLFLKMNKHNEMLGFINRYLIRAAYEYGVPTVYIESYVRVKDNVIFYKKHKNFDTNSTVRKERVHDLHRKSRMLFEAVLEQMKVKNSRQEKIFKIKEKISEKEN